MPQQAKAKKRKSHTLGKEDATNICRNEGKSIADDAYHKVLEEGGLLNIRRSLMFSSEVPLPTELVWQLKDYLVLRLDMNGWEGQKLTDERQGLQTTEKKLENIDM